MPNNKTDLGFYTSNTCPSYGRKEMLISLRVLMNFAPIDLHKSLNNSSGHAVKNNKKSSELNTCPSYGRKEMFISFRVLMNFAPVDLHNSLNNSSGQAEKKIAHSIAYSK